MLKNSSIRRLVIQACEDLKTNYPKIIQADYKFVDDYQFNLIGERSTMDFLLKNQEVYYILFNKKIFNIEKINDLANHYTLRFIKPDFKERIILSDSPLFITTLGRLLQKEARRSNSIIKNFDVDDYCSIEYRWWLGRDNFYLDNIKLGPNIFDAKNIDAFKNESRLSKLKQVYRKRLKI